MASELEKLCSEFTQVLDAMEKLSEYMLLHDKAIEAHVRELEQLSSSTIKNNKSKRAYESFRQARDTLKTSMETMGKADDEGRRWIKVALGN